MKYLTLFLLLLCSLAVRAELGAPVLMPSTMNLAAGDPVHPEARLVAALDRLSAGQMHLAMKELAQLVKEQPNFRLAQLIYGDLLQAQSGGINDLRLNSRNSRLRALIEEAHLRWSQRRDGPAEDAVPNALLRLALREERAILVDLKASRLYLMWSVGNRPRVLEDHYVGIGKAGSGKQAEGDHRTPVGAYRITDYLNRESLQEKYEDNAYLYGVGALPVSYPNLHDRLLSRTGSGIWLHGVPDKTYVRPPRSSRGCVTMANNDFSYLLKEVVPGHTLVIFSDEVEWISPTEAKIRELEVLDALEQWKTDWASEDSDAYFSHYAEDFKTPKLTLEEFLAQEQSIRAARKHSEIEIDNLSVIDYPGEKHTFLVTFRQTSKQAGLRGFVRKQQYWRKNQQGMWQIIHEGLDPET